MTAGITRRNALFGSLAAVGSAVLAACGAQTRSTERPSPTAGEQSTGSTSVGTTPTPTPTPTPTASTDPTSLSVVVNKQRPLQPQDYAPADLVQLSTVGVTSGTHNSQLRAEPAQAVKAMFDAYHAQTGGTMTNQSAYRSFAEQTGVYNGWVKSLGQAQADRQSARPGTSEHQTGLALDVAAPSEGGTIAQSFGTTRAGQWLAANAWQFGFILRYPNGGEAVTGYEYEPWHYRYLGVDLAKVYHDSGATTLEQYFGLPAAPTY